MTRDELLNEIAFIEDELGVYVYNLEAHDLDRVIKVCSALIELPDEERDDVYDAMTPEYPEYGCEGCTCKDECDGEDDDSSKH